MKVEFTKNDAVKLVDENNGFVISQLEDAGWVQKKEVKKAPKKAAKKKDK